VGNFRFPALETFLYVNQQKFVNILNGIENGLASQKKLEMKPKMLTKCITFLDANNIFKNWI